MGALFAVPLLESLDISITTLEDIEALIGVPVLGVVPHFEGRSLLRRLRSRLLGKKREPIGTYRDMLVIHPGGKPDAIEVYHSLRSAIRSRRPELSRLVLTFTSTGMAEGKTLTAVNFCLSSARAGLRTLLVGADARRSSRARPSSAPRASSRRPMPLYWA
ncbi:MAG: hypothetical protein HY748_07665 [Elusimicrobia bacterium]|nr:hypothetical protein [Elusimicrobiota bacterium]